MYIATDEADQSFRALTRHNGITRFADRWVAVRRGQQLFLSFLTNSGRHLCCFVLVHRFLLEENNITTAKRLLTKCSGLSLFQTSEWHASKVEGITVVYTALKSRPI